MSLQEYNYLDKEKKKVIDNYFDVKLENNQCLIKHIEKGFSPHTRDCFNMMAEFAFILFKSYSIDSNLKWNVLKYM